MPFIINIDLCTNGSHYNNTRIAALIFVILVRPSGLFGTPAVQKV